jgi:hypothetical protein
VDRKSAFESQEDWIMTSRQRELITAWLLVAALGLAVVVLPDRGADRPRHDATWAGVTVPGQTGWQSHAALTGVPVRMSEPLLVEDDRPVWQRGHMAARDGKPVAPSADPRCVAAVNLDVPIAMSAVAPTAVC